MRKSLREPKFKEGSTNTDLQNPYQPIQILVFQLFPSIVELNPRLGLAEIHEEVQSQTSTKQSTYEIDVLVATAIT